MATNLTHITNGMIEQSAIESSQALFTVQKATADNIMIGSKDQEKMGKLLMQIAQNSLNEAIHNLNKLLRAEEKAKHASFWEKLFGGLLTAIMCVVAAVTAQPELAVVSIALYVGSMTGGTKWAEEKIADVLHSAFGVPKSVGMIIASVIIIVAAVAVGGGGRALVGKVASLAGKGAEAGVAASAQAAEEAAEETAEEASTTASTSVRERVAGLLKKIPAPLARAITTGAMAMGSVNLAGNLGEAIHNKKVEEALEGIIAILSLVAGLVGGGALSMQGIADASALGTRVLKGAMYSATTASLGQSATGGATGYFEYEQGVDSQMLGYANAVSDLFSGIREMSTDQYNSLIKQMENLLKSEGTDSGRVTEGMSSVNASVAQLMA